MPRKTKLQDVSNKTHVAAVAASVKAEVRPEDHDSQIKSLRVSVLKLYQSTDGERASNDVARERGAKLLALFSGTLQEDVKNALDAKESGFPKGDYKRVILSECNTLYRAYLDDAETVVGLLTAPSVKTEGGAVAFGWRARVDAVRIMRKTISERRAIGVRQVLLEAAQQAGLISKSANVVDVAKQALASERAIKQAKRVTPEATAKRSVASLVKTLQEESHPVADIVAYLTAWHHHAGAAIAAYKGEHSEENIKVAAAG